MPYLQRLNVRPSLDDLTPTEARFIEANFDAHAGEVRVFQEPIHWSEVDGIEVVKAPHISGPAGWFVKRFLTGDDHYHVGIYFGHNEVVLPNVSLNTARHVVQTVAYYAPQPVRYTGIPNLSPVVD